MKNDLSKERFRNEWKYLISTSEKELLDLRMKHLLKKIQMHRNSQQYQNMYSVMKNRSICMDLNIGMKHRRENYYECTRYD